VQLEPGRQVEGEFEVEAVGEVVFAGGAGGGQPVPVDQREHRMRGAGGQVGDLAAIRVRLITTVPALRATLLHRIFAAQEELAAALRTAYPFRLDDVDAAALVGAVVGAILAAGRAAVTTGRPLSTAIDRILTTTATVAAASTT
jgi:hypothetical protein